MVIGFDALPTSLSFGSEISGFDILSYIFLVVRMDARRGISEPDRNDKKLRVADAWGDVIIQVAMVGIILVVILELGLGYWIGVGFFWLFF